MTPEPAAGPPHLRMFLADEEREREIPAAEAMPVTLDHALEEFDRLSDVLDNFIGFIRDDGEVLQFAWNDDGTLAVDVPDPVRDGSHARRASFEECRALISEFAGGLRVGDIPGLVFEPWPDA